MKRLFYLFTALLMVGLLAFPAFASDGSEAGEGELTSGSETVTETVTETVVAVPDVNVYNEVIVPDDDPGTYLGSSVSTYAAYSSGFSDLKSVLQQFLGDWETVVVTHSYQASDGSVYTVQETVPDYPWLSAAVLLCIMIFCLFRLGGSILCKT